MQSTLSSRTSEPRHFMRGKLRARVGIYYRRDYSRLLGADSRSRQALARLRDDNSTLADGLLEPCE